MTTLKLLGCFALGAMSVSTAAHADRTVRNSTEWASAVANVQPGETLLLSGQSGDYPGALTLKGKGDATLGPITIRTTQPSLVLQALVIDGSTNVVVRDLRFASPSASALIKIKGSSKVNISGNVFSHAGVRIKQKSVEFSTDGASHGNEISYNSFQDFDRSSDSPVKPVAGADSGGKPVPASFIQTASALATRIHHNHFRNIRPFIQNRAVAGDSDREAIALGTASTQQIAAGTIIESNLFEDCDGEDEIISVKTSKNQIRYNTFKNSYGSLSLRQGMGTKVYSNYFLGAGAGQVPEDPNYQTGGVRAYGASHDIYNNVFHGLSGTKGRKPIVLDAGDISAADPDAVSDKHRAATRVQVLFNTLTNNAEGISVEPVDAKYVIAAQGNVIANNLIEGKLGALFNDRGANTVAAKNIAYPTADASLGSSSRPRPNQAWTAAEVNEISASMVAVSKNGYALQAPGSGSHAYGYASAAYPGIKLDIDGQVRASAVVGADDYSSGVAEYRNKPLTALDVGPAARP
ncbi:chondroitinase-B domain-containing protein [Massilia mucilaginosa]|nr:chondroitinase-B domain-containing protein [Massilia mucilaginosa]